MKHLMIMLVLLLLVPGSMAAAADVNFQDLNPPSRPTAFEWTLATNQAATGDSDTAVNVQYCHGPKSLLITTSGATVNISFTINDDGDVISTIDGAAISSATAETLKYQFDGQTSRLYVTSTITAGTVASIKLRCN
ncbi:MAG: hypothetical protein M0024_01350 [Nitrospiraceae bacterium]|nr:hypothetical protein [Nitrospiraceae bacterium]